MREEVRQEFAALFNEDLCSLHERLLKIEAMKTENGLRLQSLEHQNKRMRDELDAVHDMFKTHEETVGAGTWKPKRLKI